MVSRTVATSVVRVSGPCAGQGALQERLGELRSCHPGALIERYLDHLPILGERVHIAPGAAIVGHVELGDEVSIWYGCVLRGDVNQIKIGSRSNVQDGAVIHVGDDDGVRIAEEVVIGHRAVVHGAVIGGGTLIGIQATILDGAVIGEGSVIGAAALVTAGTTIPPHSLVLGVPGKVVKRLQSTDEAFHRSLAGKYTRLAHNYRIG